jgi:ubiquinone biosynthesis accessory factor UbiJ
MGTMATQSPFPFLDGFLQNLPLPDLQTPAWAVHEAQRRIVLLLNHILMQETEATQRLARQKGNVVLMQWRLFSIQLTATPAGLLDIALPESKPDLTLVVTEASPLALAQAVLRGDKPTVRIEGDVQLAAEVNWLVDHVRWDLEEDVSRVLGDTPAYALGQVARAIAGALRQFLGANKAGGAAPAST